MRQDTVQYVRDLLKAAKIPGVVEYYDGDPDLIPDFNLPAIVVTKLSDELTPETIQEDTVTERIIVKLIMNKKDDWSGTIDPNNMTERKLRDIMEGRDKDSGMYLPTSIKGALRKDMDGDQRIEEGMTLELGSLPRPEGLVTMEGHLTITISSAIFVGQ